MAKTIDEKIKALNEKIAKLEEQKKSIESKITEAKQSKSVLEAKADLSCLESIKALGLSMDDLMKLAKEKATSVEESFDRTSDSESEETPKMLY